MLLLILFKQPTSFSLRKISMRSFSRTATLTLLFASALLVLASGCSNESSVEPAGVISSVTSNTIDNFEDRKIPDIPHLPDPSFIETFDHNRNEDNWSFFGNPDNKIEIIDRDGGNPGAFLHARCQYPFRCLGTYAPKLRTQLFTSSVFTGDYHARGVTHIGVDIAVFGPEYVTTEGRPLSLILRNDNDTPDDLSDDIQIYYIGTKMIPQPTGQFKSFFFEIPSVSTTMPKGWNVFYGTGSGDKDTDWNKVMLNVTQFTFFYGNPEMFFMFQQWELGADNVWITFGE